MKESILLKLVAWLEWSCANWGVTAHMSCGGFNVYGAICDTCIYDKSRWKCVNNCLLYDFKPHMIIVSVKVNALKMS